MTDNSTSAVCFQWLGDYVDLTRDDITLEEMNSAFTLRLIGGIIFVVILMTIGAIGNIHVIYIYGWKFKPSSYRIFVLWLSFIDAANFGLCAPLLIDYLLKPVTYESVPMCKIFRFLLYACAICSACALVVIAIDRCNKILRPLKQPMTRRTVKILCGACVVIAVLFSWPTLLLFTVTDSPTGIPGLIVGFLGISWNKIILYMSACEA